MRMSFLFSVRKGPSFKAANMRKKAPLFADFLSKKHGSFYVKFMYNWAVPKAARLKEPAGF